MKPISTLILLFLPCFAFSQSAKKLHAQLRAELLLAEMKQDSAHSMFRLDQQVLQGAQSDMRLQIENSLRAEERKSNKLRSAINRSVSALNELGISTADIYKVEDGTESRPNYKTFVKSIDEALNKSTRFLFISRDELKLEGLKQKEQNELMREQIQKYQTYFKYNEINAQDQRNYIAQINAFRPRIDSLSDVYLLGNAKLEKQLGLLDKKIEAARENYRLKGPKGFSDSYQLIFPDVHPVTFEATESTGEVGFRELHPITRDEPPLEIMENLDLNIYEIVDEVATFPGGMTELKRYMDENLKMPPAAKEAGISGKTYLRFVISNKGRISDIEVKKGVTDCPECDAEAVRFVKSMPYWIPAKKNGKNVHSYFSLPLTFK